MKICHLCKNEYPKSVKYFRVNKYTEDGLFHICRRCCVKENTKIIRKEYYEKNKQEIKMYQKTYQKEYYKKNKAKRQIYFKNKYLHKCFNLGKIEFLKTAGVN